MTFDLQTAPHFSPSACFSPAHSRAPRPHSYLAFMVGIFAVLIVILTRTEDRGKITGLLGADSTARAVAAFGWGIGVCPVIDRRYKDRWGSSHLPTHVPCVPDMLLSIVQAGGAEPFTGRRSAEGAEPERGPAGSAGRGDAGAVLRLCGRPGMRRRGHAARSAMGQTRA